MRAYVVIFLFLFPSVTTCPKGMGSGKSKLTPMSLFSTEAIVASFCNGKKTISEDLPWKEEIWGNWKRTTKGSFIQNHWIVLINIILASGFQMTWLDPSHFIHLSLSLTCRLMSCFWIFHPTIPPSLSLSQDLMSCARLDEPLHPPEEVYFWGQNLCLTLLLFF